MVAILFMFTLNTVMISNMFLSVANTKIYIIVVHWTAVTPKIYILHKIFIYEGCTFWETGRQDERREAVAFHQQPQGVQAYGVLLPQTVL